MPKFSNKALLRFSLASIATGVSLAVAVTTKSGDSVYAGVVAWALSAISSEAGWKSMKVCMREGLCQRKNYIMKIDAGTFQGGIFASASAGVYIMLSFRRAYC